MSAAAHERRSKILRLLLDTPAGLTREEIAENTGQTPAQVKVDLLTLKDAGRTICRSGGRAANSTNGYRRVWFAVAAKGPDSKSPLWDALTLSLKAGASINLTLELLQRLRDESGGVE